MKFTEENLESLIENGLNNRGYVSRHHSDYNRSLCLLESDLVEFIKNSQPEKWEKFVERFGSDSETKFSDLVSKHISTKGIVDGLRVPLKNSGIHFDLVYFEPKSGLNPDHEELYQKNRLQVVRQVHYSEKNENSLDMVLFINGIPVITMELKNELTGQNISHSEKQYREDRDPKEPLLKFRRCLVHFCVDQDRVSMTTRLMKDKTRFLPFNRGLENPINPNGPRTSYLWEEILTPESLLDIVENFVHSSVEISKEYDEKTKEVVEKRSDVLIFPRYHQLEVIRKLKSSLINDGVGKNYLIQHTTGSGKSYSIGWLSHLLTHLYQSKTNTNRIFDTVVVVTDRRVLDDQLGRTITSLEKQPGVVVRVESGQELRESLEKGKTIVVTTIQKFPVISEEIGKLKQRSFGIIVDEVHSSQSGETRRHLNKSLMVEDFEGDEEDDEEIDDLDSKILQIMKDRGTKSHVSFFGFTGTPKNKTIEMFGTPGPDGKPQVFHLYSMKQSIEEKFTLDVLKNYTTYERHFSLLKKIEEDPRLKESRSKRELVNLVDHHEHNVREKVRIILDHFHHVTRHKIEGKGRGMVVVKSRRMCVQYTLEMRKQLEEMGNPYNCLVGFSGTVKYDGDDYTEKNMNPGVTNIPESFKLPQNRILIVSNKFQTGFDEPLLHTMYVDKKLGGLNCVQTLSRLNRTCRGKEDTFVLDFVNDTEGVLNSFQPYYTSTELESTTDPNRLYELQSDIESFQLFRQEEVDQVCEIFLDPDSPNEKVIPVLDVVVDRWKDLEEEEREDFRSKSKSFVRLYGYISQITDFFETDWEKLYVFLRLVVMKLPRKGQEPVENLMSLVDLEYFKLEKVYEGQIHLRDETGELPGIHVGVSKPVEEEEDLLSRIIQEVNDRFGTEFSDEDRINLSQILERTLSNSELEKVHLGDNSPTNKRSSFNQVVDKEFLDMVNEKLDFYNKVKKTPELEGFILSLLYKGYLEQKGYPRL